MAINPKLEAEYVFLDEEEMNLKLDPKFKVNPPLRTMEDKQYCVDSLKNGTWVGATLSKIVCLLNHSGIENKRKRRKMGLSLSLCCSNYCRDYFP